jgi:hypothetical protein
MLVGEIGAINQSITFDPAGWPQSICHLDPLWIAASTDHDYDVAMPAKIPYFSTPRKEVVNAMIYGNASRLCAARSRRRAISTELELAAA